MQKRIIIILILIIASVAVWFFFSKRIEPGSELQPEENIVSEVKDQTSPTVILKEDKSVVSTKKTSSLENPQDKNFDEYDKNDKIWLGKVQNVLSRNEFEFYQGLRSNNEEEKMQAYQEFHDYLRQKHGDNFSYNISEDQSIREKQINAKYTQEFLKKIGPDKFKLYLNMRDQFNEEQQRKSKDGNALIIEF